MAKEAGVALVEDVDNPVIVDVSSPPADLSAAGWADGDLFADRLVAFWTQFHRLVTRKKLVPCVRGVKESREVNPKGCL